MLASAGCACFERCHLADQPVVDRFSCGLQCRSKEGVRCGTEIEMFLLCQLDQFRCRFRCEGHCFFSVNVFSGFQCLTDQPLVGRCRCQNDYHFNRRVCQNFLVGTALDAILLCFLFRMFKMACAACCYLKILKVMNHVRQINITDRSAADNADSHFFRFCCSHL